MGKLNMKPFSIGEYLKNPNRDLITRDGRKVRIICTDRKDADYPIVVLVSNKSETGEDTLYYTEEGKFYTDSTGSLDLFFAPEKKEGWVNLFRDPTDNGIYCSKVYPTKERAMDSIGAFYTTIKVEWEE